MKISNINYLQVITLLLLFIVIVISIASYYFIINIKKMGGIINRIEFILEQTDSIVYNIISSPLYKSLSKSPNILNLLFKNN